MSLSAAIASTCTGTLTKMKGKNKTSKLWKKYFLIVFKQIHPFFIRILKVPSFVIVPMQVFCTRMLDDLKMHEYMLTKFGFKSKTANSMKPEKDTHSQYRHKTPIALGLTLIHLMWFVDY